MLGKNIFCFSTFVQDRNPWCISYALSDFNFILNICNMDNGVNEVIAIAIPDQPGGLADVLGILSRNNFNVEYMYAFVNSPERNAVIIFRFDDTDGAMSVLQNAGITVLKEETLLNM